MSWRGTALKDYITFFLYGNLDRSRTSVLNISALSAAENMEKLKEVCNELTKGCNVGGCEIRFVSNTAASTTCRTANFYITSFWHFYTKKRLIYV